MKAAELTARIAAGDMLNMQIVNGRRIWWMEQPHANVAEAVVMSVLNNGALKENGDSLFGLPMNSQTWEAQP